MQSTRLIGAMQRAAVQGELSSSGLQQSTESGGVFFFLKGAEVEVIPNTQKGVVPLQI